eukprot:2955185-Amphidinium_carterae.2
MSSDIILWAFGCAWRRGQSSLEWNVPRCTVGFIRVSRSRAATVCLSAVLAMLLSSHVPGCTRHSQLVVTISSELTYTMMNVPTINQKTL